MTIHKDITLFGEQISVEEKHNVDQNRDSIFPSPETRRSNYVDRISVLPVHILQHILSFLSQKEAVQTCVLSKLWRHLGSTRPNFEFLEGSFQENNDNKFLSVLDKTLQGYRDQDLCIQEFIVWMSWPDFESVSVLKKWIPVVALNMRRLKIFNLCFLGETRDYFDIPSEIFEAKSLHELKLEGCKFNFITNKVVLFKHLQTLHLTRVYIEDETFEKIISSNPLIEYVTLNRCEGLKTFKVSKVAANLKDFDLTWDKYDHDIDQDRSIEIDAPTLETIRIDGSESPNKWYHHQYRNYFPHLKSLYLRNVQLSPKSQIFSSSSCNNFPCLEELELDFSRGMEEEFQLSSRSIKRLSITVEGFEIKAAIDVPNIRYFYFRSDNFLPSISSFATNNNSTWKSDLHLTFNINIDDTLSWFLKLHQMLKALSQSEISLYISPSERIIEDVVVRPLPADTTYEAVAVEHLYCSRHGYEDSWSAYSTFVNNCYRICYPRHLGLYEYLELERQKQSNTSSDNYGSAGWN
ncbi:hypothetical protein DH2020_041945 [Rehmannia glutinosa]|uniref:F-box domain-containing protein n=1 Tax=Rehmannia glutinosa TaxID=99300 RepID=A0ABR0UNS4_REHGL